MANQNSIMQRIAKLLAVQEVRGATEAEASVAAEHVQRLLQEHNLTLSQVEEATGDTTQVKREKAETETRATFKWSTDLMSNLAENNFCLHRVKTIFIAGSHWGRSIRYVDGQRLTGHYEKRHLLVGRTLNIQVTRDTYDYLCQAIKRAADEAGYVPHAGKRTREQNWFYEGCVDRLVTRLIERRHEAERESEERRTTTAGNGSGRELVLSDVYGSEADLNNDTLNGFPAGTTATRRRAAQEKQARQQARHDELVAEGMDSTKAWYVVYGYGDERAEQLANNWNRRVRRGGRGRSQGWTRADSDNYHKERSAAFKAGREAGARISLDSQVGSGHAPKRITG